MIENWWVQGHHVAERAVDASRSDVQPLINIRNSYAPFEAQL
jgi:hypothetical protein